MDEEIREIEETIETLYYPGRFGEGEALCLDVLENVDPESETACLYLVLNLAGQNLKTEALELARELPPELITAALDELAFGAGTPAEAELYRELIRLGEEAGLGDELERFFSTPVRPLEEHEKVTLPPRWVAKPDLSTTFMLDLKRHDPRYAPDLPEPHDRPDPGRQREYQWEWVSEDELDDPDPDYEYEVIEVDEEEF